MKRGIGKKYQMLREELQSRDEGYRQGQIEKDNDLSRVLEGRDKDIIDTLSNRDQLWLNSLKSFTNHLKAINDFQLDLRRSMESLAQKQDE